MRSDADVEFIQQYGHNPRYLSDVMIDLKTVQLCTDINACIQNNDIILLAVPSAFVHDTLKDLPKDCFKNKTLIYRRCTDCPLK
jgi:glycerol-3-phosphate dehydrogenase (NAD(P)+)